MALQLEHNTFILRPESNEGSCVCTWSEKTDIPKVDDNALKLFRTEFERADQDGKNWTIKTRRIDNSQIIPRVELTFISTKEEISNISSVTVQPRVYNRRAELLDVLKNVDGRGENKIAVFNTYKNIIKNWDRANDWSDDPELKTPGSNGLRKCDEWSFTSYNSTSQMKKWNATDGVTSSIPFDVRKLSPYPIKPGLAVPDCFLLKDGEEEYNFWKNYSIKMYKCDAVMWVFSDGTEWEPN